MTVLRSIVRRLCPSFILPSSSSSSPSSSVHLPTDDHGGESGKGGNDGKREDADNEEDIIKEEEKDDSNDEENNDLLTGPRPSFTNTRQVMLSSRSSFLHLPSISPVSPKHTKKNKKLSLSPTYTIPSSLQRPSTAPSTPTTSSPRLLRSLSRFNVAGPSTPSLPLPRLSFSNSPNSKAGHGRYTATAMREEDDNITPPLSFCSKEVAEDPFARVCPSPEFSRPSTSSRSYSASAATSPTTSRTPSARRRASSKSPMLSGQLGKSAPRPSTAPGLASYSSSSKIALSSAPSSCTAGLQIASNDYAGKVQDPFRADSIALTSSMKQGKMTRPALAPLSTTNATSSSYTFDQSYPQSLFLSSSPSSPDLVSTFSSSYSSVRSAFSDDTFTTLDTVVTSNVSNEGGIGYGAMGRMRSNANTMDMDDIAPLLEKDPITSSPVMQDGFFHTAAPALPSSLPPSNERITPSPDDKMKKDGKAKMLLGMPSLKHFPSSPIIFHETSSSSATSTPKLEKEEDETIPNEIVQRGFEAQERLRSKHSIRPAHVHSRFIEELHEDPLFALNAEDASTPHSMNTPSSVHGSGRLDLGVKGTILPACRRSFTAPPAFMSTVAASTLDPLSSDCIITDSISAHPIEEEGEEGSAAILASEVSSSSATSTTSTTTDYANSHFAFTQSSYDLVLSYGGEERTAIPLPQTSWFPEPPPFATCTLLTASDSRKDGRKTTGGTATAAAGAAGRQSQNRMGRTMIWNEVLGKARPRISEMAIGYPLKRD
ncbi:hypothetical protein P389DRAFT_11760 [Cystobasidium minutum MCA 4210]|uniref:uncharacterized protein n=1 Tax=Cystobasidium minutum MCA 4210 TaxID=1397322 RepID=UPI0034CFC50C|eukprot:jgi/Rhomi1/11760/CE11759_238